MVTCRAKSSAKLFKTYLARLSVARRPEVVMCKIEHLHECFRAVDFSVLGWRMLEMFETSKNISTNVL